MHPPVFYKNKTHYLNLQKMKTISISNIILATILSTFSLASCEAKSSDLMPDTELIEIGRAHV